MGSRRTYLPGLYDATHELYVYMTRWQDKIKANSTSQQNIVFDAALNNIANLQDAYPKAPPEPDDE